MTKHVEMIIDYITDGTDLQYYDNHGLLIRCKDCAHCRPGQLEETKDKLFCGYIEDFVEDGDYCSFAERRD